MTQPGRPAVFIHGLWLHASSWGPWLELFQEAGYAPTAPGWPGDPDTVEESRRDPSRVAGKGIDDVVGHYARIIRELESPPVVIGHSFGGLLTEILAGRGLAAASVAISPAPARGVLPLPLSALRSASVALKNPANYNKAVPLTYEQFRYSFANAVGEDEAKELYATFAVPASGAPLFQAATANFNPWTEDQVNTRNHKRGPLLLIAGEQDHTVPLAVVKAAYQLQQHNPAVTEFRAIPNRGHSLVIDHGWRDVAEIALAFIARQLSMG